MTNSFETKIMKIMVEEITYANSAFATNEQGDAVFLNTRIVERMNLEGGEILMAHCIPNYEDKRDQIPWRCVRVGTSEGHPEDLALPLSKIDDFMLRSLKFGPRKYWSVAELAEILELNIIDVQAHFNNDNVSKKYETFSAYRMNDP